MRRFGLVLLAVADDSFLFLPIDSDMLSVVLVARNHAGLGLYSLATAVGSTVSVFLWTWSAEIWAKPVSSES